MTDRLAISQSIAKSQSSDTVSWALIEIVSNRVVAIFPTQSEAARLLKIQGSGFKVIRGKTDKKTMTFSFN